MKRDMELIRLILLKIEESDGSELTASEFAEFDGRIVGYHFRLIDDAGFLLSKHHYNMEDGPVYFAGESRYSSSCRLLWNMKYA